MREEKYTTKVHLMYSPQYDCLMLAYPIYPRSHWYKFLNDPWGYEGTAAHRMEFLKNDANFVVIDSWIEDNLYTYGDE